VAPITRRTLAEKAQYRSVLLGVLAGGDPSLRGCMWGIVDSGSPICGLELVALDAGVAPTYDRVVLRCSRS